MGFLNNNDRREGFLGRSQGPSDGFLNSDPTQPSSVSQNITVPSATQGPPPAPATPDANTYSAQTSKAATGTADTYTAKQRKVGDKQLVSSTIASILDADNPYIQRAREKALETANSRGLLNSSIAANAGTAAAIDKAYDVATKDTEAYRLARQDNQAAVNEARQFNTGERNDMRTTNVIERNDMRQDNNAAVNASRKFGADSQNTFDKAAFDQANDMQSAQYAQVLKKDFLEADANVRASLGAIEQQYAMELTNLKEQYAIAQNLDTVTGTIYDGGLRSLATLLNNDELSGDEVKRRAGVIIDSMKSGLSWSSQLDSVDLPTYGEGDAGDGGEGGEGGDGGDSTTTADNGYVFLNEG